jgi:hypothetical protein
VDFKEATDRLTARVTLADIAEACGSHPNSIDRARLEPSSKSYRSPPPDWENAVAKLAKERGEALLALAGKLAFRTPDNATKPK